MKSLKNAVLFMSLILSSTTFSQNKEVLNIKVPTGAKETGNGGGFITSTLVTQTGQAIIDTLKTRGQEFVKHHKLDLEALEETINVERWIVTDEKLIDSTGAIVDALHDQEADVIQLNRDAWMQFIKDAGDQVSVLFFHEMLRLVGVDDDNYTISGKYLELIETIRLDPAEQVYLQERLKEEIENCSYKNIRYYLDRGASPKVRLGSITGLMYAMRNCKSERGIAYELEARGADLTAQTKNNLSVLMLAIAHGYEDIAHQAIDADANVNLVRKNNNYAHNDDKGKTALHYAARRSGPLLVRKLLAEGANPNISDYDGRTPLLLAVKSQYTRPRNWHPAMQADLIVEELLENDADPNLGRSSSEEALCTPLGEAIGGEKSITMKLIRAGANVNFTQKYSESSNVYDGRSIKRKLRCQSPAIYAAIVGEENSIFKLMIDHGLNINLRVPSKRASYFFRDKKILDIEYPKDNFGTAYFNHSLLESAIVSGNLEIAQELIDRGASFQNNKLRVYFRGFSGTYRGEAQTTLLGAAVLEDIADNSFERTRLVLSLPGYDVNSRAISGKYGQSRTALFMTPFFANAFTPENDWPQTKNMAEYLIHLGADKSIRDDLNKSAYDYLANSDQALKRVLKP